MPAYASECFIHADWLISMDQNRQIFRDGALAVSEGKIAAVGTTREILERYHAPVTHDLSGKLVTPGLIDSHIHTAFQLSRGLADESGSQQFLFRRMYPYEGLLTEEEAYWSAALCVLEEIRHGATCIIDPGNYHPGQTVAAVARAGMRAVVAKSAMDVGRSPFGTLPPTFQETTEEAYRRSEAVLKDFHNTHGGRIRASLSFRGINNASDDLIRRLQHLAGEAGVLLQTHACFAKETRDSSVGAHGMTEVERLFRLGVLGPNVLLIHLGWATSAELHWVRDHAVKVVEAASSSLHNGYGCLLMGHIPELLEMGVTVGLGSDHASSGMVDLVQEMFLAGGGYKEVRLDAGVMRPEQVLEMATIYGARCALWEDEIGSLEPGKAADFTVFDLQRPEWQPLVNPVANLVYSATGSSVSDVFVAGRPVLQDGRAVNLDEAEVFGQVKRLMPSILEKTGLTETVMPRWPIIQ